MRQTDLREERGDSSSRLGASDHHVRRQMNPDVLDSAASCALGAGAPPPTMRYGRPVPVEAMVVGSPSSSSTDSKTEPSAK